MVARTSKLKPIDLLHLGDQDRQVMHVGRITGHCLSNLE